MSSTPSATELTIALAAQHIAEQQERIADQRVFVAETEAAGNTQLAMQARRHLSEMCEWLAMMHREEREAKKRLDTERSEEEPAQVAHMADVMREYPL